ncbi:hypothetical protein FAZ95_10950 [Trinickia violacea]|uniref:Uncharacterized protein n=1 Tax=Trinickia violacea TaxID=2571746 RepID=A0A4P8IR62_9BURK|nr:hypothetical protein [Trinickia violacea]QCP49643.1 hypothetical protein FAZ95_10950 [Trinickia violacea]
MVDQIGRQDVVREPGPVARDVFLQGCPETEGRMDATFIRFICARDEMTSGMTVHAVASGPAKGELGYPNARPIMKGSRAEAGPESSKGLEISPWDAVAGPRKRLRQNAGVFFCAVQSVFDARLGNGSRTAEVSSGLSQDCG